MSTFTMAVQSFDIRRFVYGAVAVLLLAGALVGFLAIPGSNAQVTNADLGAFERAYFLDGNSAPVFVDTGVNESIAFLASVNARAASDVRPGDDVIGNSERLMFGIK